MLHLRRERRWAVALAVWLIWSGPRMGSLCCVRSVRVLSARRVTLTIVTRLLPLAKVLLTRCVFCWRRGGLHCHWSLCCHGLVMICWMLATIVLLRLGEERQRCWIGLLCCASGGRAGVQRCAAKWLSMCEFCCRLVIYCRWYRCCGGLAIGRTCALLC